MMSSYSAEQFHSNSTSDYFMITGYDLDTFFNNFTNTSSSSRTPAERDLLREIPLGIVLTFLCLLTTVGNAMVLHAVRTERRLQSVSMLSNFNIKGKVFVNNSVTRALQCISDI